jgi:hypothetical protein
MPPCAVERFGPRAAAAGGVTQQLQSSKATRIRLRSSSWGYGGIVGSQLDSSLCWFEIRMAGGEVGAAMAAPVERPHTATHPSGCGLGPSCRSAILQERTLGGVIVDLDVAIVDLGEWVWPVLPVDQANSHLVGLRTGLGWPVEISRFLAARAPRCRSSS